MELMDKGGWVDGPFSAMGSLRPTHLKPQKLINLFNTCVSGPMSLSKFFLTMFDIFECFCKIVTS